MARVKKPSDRPEGAQYRANDRQTLGERIRYLRANAKPYMTRRQLSQLTGIKQEKIALYESGDPKHINMTLDTLRKIAHALDVRIYINLKTKYDARSRRSEECLPLGHDLPPLPKLKRTWKEANLRLAAKFQHYQAKKPAPKKRRASPKAPSDKPSSSGQSFDYDPTGHAMPASPPDKQ